MSGAAAYRLLRAALERFERAPAQLTEAERTAAQQQAEQEGALQQRVLAAPEAAGVTVSEAEIEQAIAAIAERFDSPEHFAQALADNDLDRGELAAAVAIELRVERVLEQVAAQAPAVTDAELEQVYDTCPEHWRRPETRRVRHILITINEELAENRRPRAWQRAEGLAEALRADPNPDHFARLAERHSECPSALHGGLIGRVPRGQLHAELDEALFAMTAGEVSDPIETALGFHVLLCEACYEAETAPFTEVREPLRERLQQQRGRAAQRRWMRSLLAAPGDDA